MLRLSLLLLLMACGDDKSQSLTGEPATTTTSQNSFSMLVAAKSDLPTCDKSREGNLAYVKTESVFYACASSSWETVTIKGEKGDVGASGVAGAAGPAGATGATGAAGTSGNNGANGIDGMVISETWKFTRDTFSAPESISTESATLSTFIGTVILHKFSNGGGVATVSGAVVNEDSNLDIYTESFSHTFFLSSTSAQQDIILRFTSYASAYIRYRATLGATPVFRAVVDVDGSFADNIDTTYSMVKQN